MKIKNKWCRIAWFLEGRRASNDYKFEHITRDRRVTKAMHSMYWREK